MPDRQHSLSFARFLPHLVLAAAASIPIAFGEALSAREAPVVARRADPVELLAEAEVWVLRGEVMRALSAYREANTLNSFFEIGAGSWNRLCWYGSLWGHAEEVLEACNRAVSLAPDNVEILDSRGLARALTGDFEGAIADFEAFVEETEDDRRRVQRQEWIDALQRDENPFTEEVLELLFFD